MQIRRNFVLKFVHEIFEKFVHAFMHKFMLEDDIFKERIWGKYQYHEYYLRYSSAEFYLHDQTLRHVDIIKGNILFKII